MQPDEGSRFDFPDFSQKQKSFFIAETSWLSSPFDTTSSKSSLRQKTKALNEQARLKSPENVETRKIFSRNKRRKLSVAALHLSRLSLNRNEFQEFPKTSRTENRGEENGEMFKDMRSGCRTI